MKRLITATPERIVQDAMEVPREAQNDNEVKNPAGFLYAAIRDAWNHNEQLHRNNELAKFNEW